MTRGVCYQSTARAPEVAPGGRWRPAAAGAGGAGASIATTRSHRHGSPTLAGYCAAATYCGDAPFRLVWSAAGGKLPMPVVWWVICVDFSLCRLSNFRFLERSRDSTAPRRQRSGGVDRGIQQVVMARRDWLCALKHRVLGGCGSRCKRRPTSRSVGVSGGAARRFSLTTEAAGLRFPAAQSPSSH